MQVFTVLSIMVNLAPRLNSKWFWPVTSDYSMNVVCFLSYRKESSQQQIVVPVTGIPYQLSTYQLTEENTDFSYRDKRHQSSMVTSIGPQ